MKTTILFGLLLLGTTMSLKAQISTPSGVVTSTTNNSGTTADFVGIGTTTPAAKLDVKGNIYSDGLVASNIFSGLSGGDVIFTSGTAAGAGLLFKTALVECMRITGAGNVGIGTPIPSVKLDIVGDVKITGNLVATTLKRLGGTASQFLMADGSVSTATNTFLPLVGGTVTGDIVIGTDDRDNSIYGTYDPLRTQQIWSIGTAYRSSPIGTDFGTLFGIAYKHTNNGTGGTMAGGHQIVFTSAGIPKSAIGLAGNIWTSGEFRGAGTGLTGTAASLNIGGNSFSANTLITNLNADLETLTTNGIYRQETPSSAFNYTTTLNMSSVDGRQQLTIGRSGDGMKFRGTATGSGSSWNAWKTVVDNTNFNSYASNYFAANTNNIYANDGVLSGTRTITMGANPITFNGTGKYILNTGNVGIGTTNPSVKLEVNGDLKASKGVFTNSLPDGSSFSSATDRNDKCLVFAAGSLLGSGSGYLNARMLQFYDFPQSNIDAKSLLYFSIEDRLDKRRFRVVAQTGGTTEMSVWNKNQEDLMKVYEDGNDNVYMQLGKPNSRLLVGGYADDANSIGHKLFVKGSAKIEGNIFTDSNICIGTPNFADGTDIYRLSVKGKIRAEEVKVYTTWADYVFNSTYKLPSLREVETYIAANGHLQNVPSAKEIEEKGLELGEMAKIQQEKIEELTLYLIQQNKDIEELKAQLKVLMAK